MVSNSTVLARPLLSTLGTLTDYAFLHGEAGVAAGQPTSDLDLVVSRPAAVVLCELIRAETTIRPLLVWNYDVGSWTSFWLDLRTGGGIQLDLTRDPLGQGRYGMKTQAFLRDSTQGVVWPRLADSPGGWLYLLRKRQVKRNESELRRLLSLRPEQSPPLEEYFSEAAADDVRTLLAPVPDLSRAARWQRVPQWKRTAVRTAIPTGVRLPTGGEELRHQVEQLMPPRTKKGAPWTQPRVTWARGGALDWDSHRDTLCARLDRAFRAQRLLGVGG